MGKDKKVKAFLLAAGLGTRLKPLTDHTPKVLLPIGNKPLLQYWFEDLARCGVKDALINTHWLNEQVESFAKENAGIYGLNITISYESKLLGSAGTLLENRIWAKDASEILIIYADNFTDFRLKNILDYHSTHSKPFTLSVFETEQPKRCGIVQLDSKKNVIDFIEKPDKPQTNLAAGGIYVADSSILQELGPWNYQTQGSYDLGKHVLPNLVGRMTAYIIKGFFIDIGTPEAYEAALNWEGMNS